MVDENKVLELLAEQDIKAEIVDVKKNNNIVMRGVCAGDGNIRPTLYFKDFDTPEQMVGTIIEHLTHLPDMDEIDCLRDWEWVSERLRVMLSRNPTTLLTLPGICDLKMVAYVKISDNARVIVTREMFEQYGRGIEPFFVRAVYNTRDKEGIKLLPIDDLIADITGFRFDSLESEVKMNVLTNNRCMYGAAALLYLEEVINSLSDRFYMIPSSIHETILLWPTDVVDIEELNKIIKEVNANSIAPEEVLSDHAYLYDNGIWKEV